ncbi:SHOCT domain-containing protein [Mycolicibacterium sp. XJ1819]
MRRAVRIVLVGSILTLVTAIVGFIAVLILNAFVFDEFDAHGEVDVPGTGSLHLPQGEVTISFHTLISGQPTSGLPVPQLQMSITPPPGVPEPTVTESLGGTTTVNNDAHVRVWTAHIAEPGDYEIVTDGEVGGYIDPRLAFGDDRSHGWLLWPFGGLFALSLVMLAAALTGSARIARNAAEADPLPTPPPPEQPAVPSEQGIRLEQLRQLAALRDSGALTEDEYTAEKRRILG